MTQPSPPVSTRFKWIIIRVKINLWMEKHRTLFLSLFGIWGGYLCLGMAGVPQTLPDFFRYLLLAGLAVASFILIMFNNDKTTSKPSFKTILKHIETVNQLSFQPLQTLYDHPVQQEDETLWKLHQQRLLETVPVLKTGFPYLFNLRNHRDLLTVFLCIGMFFFIIIKSINVPSRLVSSFRPGYDDATIPLPTIQAWIVPPYYSHVPTQLLSLDKQAITADPHGKLTIFIANTSSPPRLFSVSSPKPLTDLKLRKLDHKHWQLKGTLSHSGTVVLKSRGRKLAEWNFNIPVNRPPEITWTASIHQDNDTKETVFPFKINTHYGIQNAFIDIRLANQPTASIAKIPIPLDHFPQSVLQNLNYDFSSTIWAGEKATAYIQAEDVTHQTSHSHPLDFTLPSIRFSSPLAQKLNLVRVQYGKNIYSEKSTALALLHHANSPEILKNYGVFLNFDSLVFLIFYNQHTQQKIKPEIMGRLWELILTLEANYHSPPDIAMANKNLQAAEQNLTKKLQTFLSNRSSRLNNDQYHELEQALQTFKETMAEKISALAKNNENMKDLLQSIQNGTLPSAHLDNLFQEIEDNIRQGNLQQAQKTLRKLSNRLRHLQKMDAKQMEAIKNHIQQQKTLQKIQQQLQLIIKEQTAILNDTHHRMTASRNDLLTQSPEALTRLSSQALLEEIGAAQSASSAKIPTVSENIEKENGLLQQLENIRKQAQNLLQTTPENLSHAEQNMQSALDQFKKGNDPQSIPFQEQALLDLQNGTQALQKAIHEKQQEFSQNFPIFSFVPSTPAEQKTENNPGKQDILGRPVPNDSYKMKLFNKSANSQEIEKILYQQLADPHTSKKEKEYFKRLLNIF